MTVPTSLVRMEGHAEISMKTTPAGAPHHMLESSASYVCSPPLDTLISDIYNLLFFALSQHFYKFHQGLKECYDVPAAVAHANMSEVCKG